MREYDLVVVGAGIQGAGVAQAAAAAGHSVLVLEKCGVAAGTSRKSSKLIHGGLRYLETGQLRLVRECLRERSLLLELAPELVHLRDFYLPIYKHTRRRPWQIRIGLALYWCLANFRADSAFRSIPREDWDKLEGLSVTDLEAVYAYRDAQTDDAKLTQAVIHSAIGLGAELVVPGHILSAELLREKVEIAYEQDGQTVQCQAGVLVNAAGPWVNSVLELVTPAQILKTIEFVQGAHIILPGAMQEGIYYVESTRDGRAVFVMPWYGQTLVGTTETKFSGDLEQVMPLESEKRYLLSVFRRYFPSRRDECIIDAFAGLRVLPADARHAFHRTRETSLVFDRKDYPRLVSIYGGKLTAYRALGEKVLRSIARSLPTRLPRGDTKKLILGASSS